MSDSRRRSTRRVKRRSSTYATNDLVQVPKSNTTVIGRLVSQLSESPSRWLVAFENYDDEEFAEETLGRVVGRAEEYPASDDDQVAAPVQGGSSENMETQGSFLDAPPETTTRSKRRSSQNGGNTSMSKSNSGGSGGTNSSGENSPVEDLDTAASKRKKKGVTFTSSARSRSNSEVSSVPSPNKLAESDLNAVSQEPAHESSYNSKVSDREQRSRRRQAMSQEEAFQASLEASTNHKAGPGSVKRPLPGTNKGLIGLPKNKKNKSNKNGGEVLKVKLLTGTLFLSKGIHRHVEFIPKV